MRPKLPAQTESIWLAGNTVFQIFLSRLANVATLRMKTALFDLEGDAVPPLGEADHR